MIQGPRGQASSGPLGLNPVLPHPGSGASGLQLPFSGTPMSTGDDHSTCHKGLLKVINIHISCGRRVFFLDGTAWPFRNRTFCCGEQRRPVSESVARKLLGRQANSHFPDS